MRPPDPHDRQPEEQRSTAERHLHQAEERIEELKTEVERLREGYRRIINFWFAESRGPNQNWEACARAMRSKAEDILDENALDAAEDGPDE